MKVAPVLRVLAGDDVTEHRVTSVEVRRRALRDEKLRTVRAGAGIRASSLFVGRFAQCDKRTKTAYKAIAESTPIRKSVATTMTAV